MPDQCKTRFGTCWPRRRARFGGPTDVATTRSAPEGITLISRALVFIVFQRYDALSSRSAVPLTLSPHRNVVVMRRRTRRRRSRELILLCLFIAFGLLLHLCLPGPPPPPHAFAATPQHWRSEVERAHDAAAAVTRRQAPAVAREESITYRALPDRERHWLETQPRPDAPAGPMELFTASGRPFPVVVIACDRTETLRNALTSLMALGQHAAHLPNR